MHPLPTCAVRRPRVLALKANEEAKREVEQLKDKLALQSAVRQRRLPVYVRL